MKCSYCGQDSTTTHKCIAGFAQSTTVPLSQEYNVLRGASTKPGPDYAKFGEACAEILRRFALPHARNTAFNAAARAHQIPLEEEK